jgi:hypothetical protein
VQTALIHPWTVDGPLLVVRLEVHDGCCCPHTKLWCLKMTSLDCVYLYSASSGAQL